MDDAGRLRFISDSVANVKQDAEIKISKAIELIIKMWLFKKVHAR